MSLKNLGDVFSLNEIKNYTPKLFNNKGKILALNDLKYALTYLSLCSLLNYDTAYIKYKKLIESSLVSIEEYNIKDIFYFMKCNEHIRNDKLNDVIVKKLTNILGNKALTIEKYESRINDYEFILYNYSVVLSYFSALPRIHSVHSRDLIENVIKTYLNLHEIINKNNYQIMNSIIGSLNFLSWFIKQISATFFDELGVIFKKALFDFELTPGNMKLDIRIFMHFTGKYLDFITHQKTLPPINDLFKKIHNIIQTYARAEIGGNYINKYLGFPRSSTFFLQKFKIFDDYILTIPSISQKETDLLQQKQDILTKLHNIWQTDQGVKDFATEINIICSFKGLMLRSFKKTDPAIIKKLKLMRERFKQEIEKEENLEELINVMYGVRQVLNKEEQQMFFDKISSKINELKNYEFDKLSRSIYQLVLLNYDKDILQNFKTDYFIKLFQISKISDVFNLKLEVLITVMKLYMDNFTVDDDSNIIKRRMIRGNSKPKMQKVESPFAQIETSKSEISDSSMTKEDLQKIMRKIHMTLLGNPSRLSVFSSHLDFVRKLSYLTFKIDINLFRDYYKSVIYPILELNFRTIDKKDFKMCEWLFTSLNTTASQLCHLENCEELMAYNLKLITKLIVIMIKNHNIKHQGVRNKMEIGIFNLFHRHYNMNPEPYDRVEKWRPKYKFVKLIFRKRYMLSGSYLEDEKEKIILKQIEEKRMLIKQERINNLKYLP